MKTKRLVVSWFALAILTFVIASCANPTGSSSSRGGSLSIQLTNNINARTLLPPIDMNAASFTVSGLGPGGATFSQSTSGGSVTVSDLAFGSWSVTVNALNAGGTLIGSGQATVTVHTGQTSTVAISVVPLSGNGTLDLTVTWTASQVEIPSIKATLTPSSGAATALSFSIAGNQATYSSTTIPAGYQTLTLQLLDNNLLVMGAVEVARIVAGQTTTGSYAFTNVNQPGGSVQVNITPAMADPIPVGINGVSSTITAGTSVTATASVSDGTSGVVYVWYLNGVSQATGSSYTFGSTLAAGYYRLDVTAYTADGTRAGSGTASFQVTANGTQYSTWTARTLPSSSDWYWFVTYGNGTFVAVSQSNAGAISPDGINWTATTLPSYLPWTVTYGNDTFVAVAAGASNAAATSLDGITWTARTLPSSQMWYCVTYGNGTFVATSQGNAAATSPDGITWTARTLPSWQLWYCVTYGNGTFVAVAGWGMTSNAAATSPDGIIWTARTLPSSQYWRSVTYGNGTFVAISPSGAGATSPDGITWTATTLPSGGSFQSVTYGNGTFVAVSYYSNVGATSPDGINWTATTLPSSGGYFDVAYGNGIFVAVPPSRGAATSP